jgi:hypothetical protein
VTAVKLSNGRMRGSQFSSCKISLLFDSLIVVLSPNSVPQQRLKIAGNPRLSSWAILVDLLR